MGIGNRIKLNRKKRAIKIRILLEQVPLTYNRRYVVTQLDLGEGKYGLDFAFCKIMNAPWPPPLPPPPPGRSDTLQYILYPGGEPDRSLASAADNRRQDLVALCALAVMFDGSVQTARCGYI